MRRYIRMYRVFFKQFLKTLMQSKSDFWLGFFAFFLRQISNVVLIGLVFNQIPNLLGWNFNEIIFIYGFSQISRGLDHIFTNNIWFIASTYVVNGSFDRYLLRPINPLFHICSEKIQPDGIGELMAGVLLTIYTGLHLTIRITALSVVLFPVSIILATILYTSIKLMYASLAFWVKDSLVLLTIAYDFSEFAKYPISIYASSFRFVVSYIIPFAYTSFFPASYFLGVNDFLNSILPQAIVTGVFFIIAYGLFEMGMNRYESTGN